MTLATGTYAAFQSSCVVGGNTAKTVRDFAQMHDETIMLGILFEYYLETDIFLRISSPFIENVSSLCQRRMESHLNSLPWLLNIPTTMYLRVVLARKLKPLVANFENFT